jgi:type IV pilus assembly protein PilN
MRITLNLATRPFTDVGPAMKRLRIAMAVLVVVGIGLLLGLRQFDQKAEAARAREHSLDGQIAAINQERQQYQAMMRAPQNAEVVEQADALNRLIDKKTFSWTLAMEDLETVLPGGVQVSTLEPARDEKTGIISVHLRVIGPRDKAVDLVRNLEHSRRFLLPQIVGENSEANNAPGQRLEPVSVSEKVNFDLLANYNPPAPGERRPAKKRTAEASNTGEPHPLHPLSGTFPKPGQPTSRTPYTGPGRAHKALSQPGGPQ